MSRGQRWRICSVSCVLWLSASISHAESAPATPPGAKVSAGQLIAEEKSFLVGPEGATLNLVEGAELRLDAGARVRFGRTFKLPMGSTPDSIIPTRVLMLDSGWMEAKLLAKHFALFVETPRKLRSLLLEGSLTVIASEPRSTVALVQGSALVALDAGWKWKRLSEGSAQIVSDVRPDGYRHSLLTAIETPVLSRSLMLSGSGDDASTLLAWPALPQALGYEVQLRRATDARLAEMATAAPEVAVAPSVGSSPAVAAVPAATGDTPLLSAGGAGMNAELPVRSVRTKESRIQLADLAPGTYQVTVRGMDESGIFGPASAPVALNVVGLEIPKTASRGANGSVRLQANQRVTLIGAEGLLVAYLGLDDFMPAPKSIGLVARRPISLVLRHPVSGETLRLDLEPLSVRAQISFAQHPQNWPIGGLELAVKLVDDRGDAVPENFPVTCKVTINIQPTEPIWERKGSVLRTRLANPIGAAPWMVRVDVRDENGASLGMDFAEIGYEAAASAGHAQR